MSMPDLSSTPGDDAERDGEPAAASTPAPTASAGDAEDGDLALPADTACDLLSSHGGEIVITDDGRVVFMNASAHLVELAAALDPENEEIQARLAIVRRVEVRRAKRDDPED